VTRSAVIFPRVPQPVVHMSEAVDISSTDHTFVLKTTAIYCGGAGNLIARLRGDSTDRTWVVQAGQYVLGDFLKVTRTSTTATAMIGVRDRTGSGD
jgi:hypothetical protein